MVKEKSTNELIKELLEKRDHESKNQIEKYSIPEKFRYTTIAQRSVPFVVYIKFYDEKALYSPKRAL